MSHATFIHFPSLKLVLFISSKLTKRGLPSPPPVYRFPVLNFCSTCLINASLQSNPWQMPIGNAQNEVIGCNPQLGGVPGLPKLL